MRTLLIGVFVVLVTALTASAAEADEEQVDEARALFKEGAALVEQSEWARALVAFEQSRAAREHALTIFNIGVCQRFLGRSTLARETFRAALARNVGSHEMPALFVDQAETYLAEIERSLAHVMISLTPASTAVAVDGRPLVESGRLFVAGLGSGGAGKSVGRARFEVVVDPGPAAFTFTLAGHETIEIKRELKPGSTTELPVSMTEQPATIRVASDRPRAVVRLDDVDVGLTPVLVSRPPGAYRLTVAKPGFVTYDSKVALEPGQDFKFDAKLAEESVPLTKKWWFWATSGALAAAVGVATYLIVRPEPTRPELEKGGLNWAAEVR